QRSSSELESQPGAFRIRLPGQQPRAATDAGRRRGIGSHQRDSSVMSEAAVQSISLYPIKSLDAVMVEAARVLSGGAFEHDREFALFDEQGKVINGKREPRIHQVRASYDLDRFVVTLNESKSFHLVHSRRELEDWFGQFLRIRVSIERNTETGFPDDLESPGPTIVSSASLREVSTWFGIADLQEPRRRFRANIEIATDEPFWEDRLFAEADA